jgi:hypothetical protein
MIFGQHNWVCSVCGQGVTRKSSASRHNDNLHHGDAKIIRPYDYIIGRLNGEFPSPSDPLLYRRNNNNRKRSKKNASSDPIHYYYDYENNNNDMEWGHQVVSPQGNTLPPKRQQYQSLNNDNITYRMPSYPPPPHPLPVFQQRSQYPLHKTINDDNNNDKPSHFDKMLERMSKLEELKILLNRHYSPQHASQFLAMITYMVSQGKEDFLDERLTFLRNIDRAKSVSL